MLIPAAIIFVNNDLTDSVRDQLERQLYISETLDGYIFDDRVTVNPNYPTLVKNSDLRLMVVRSFEELQNRDLADVVIFCKAGEISVEENKFGRPRATWRIAELTWWKLSIF